MVIVDEWRHHKTVMAETFQDELDKRPKGNPAEVIDYTGFTVGKEVKIKDKKDGQI